MKLIIRNYDQNFFFANTQPVIIRLIIRGGNEGGGGGGGAVQKQPKSYKVGTTTDAPTAGTSIWSLSEFENSYVVLFLNGRQVPLSDIGDGSPYLTKVLSSTTITITNYAWQTGDELTYILITP